MAETNSQIAKKAMADYKNAIINEVESRCRTYCDALCDYAITFREEGGGHNYTGNLLNSIIVCLYKERRPIYACHAAGHVRKAIQVKMTYPHTYHFKQDYDGEESNFAPSEKTDKGWGEEDAKKFFNSYKPSGKNIFDIVVAYPVEYAGYVGELTGIVDLYAHTEIYGINFLQLPKAS